MLKKKTTMKVARSVALCNPMASQNSPKNSPMRFSPSDELLSEGFFFFFFFLNNQQLKSPRENFGIGNTEPSSSHMPRNNSPCVFVY